MEIVTRADGKKILNFGQGAELPIVGFVEASIKDDNGNEVDSWNLPVIEGESDHHWQLSCLQSRLKNPKLYEEMGEDVKATIDRLLQWLKEHTPREYIEQWLTEHPERIKQWNAEENPEEVFISYDRL